MNARETLRARARVGRDAVGADAQGVVGRQDVLGRWPGRAKEGTAPREGAAPRGDVRARAR